MSSCQAVRCPDPHALIGMSGLPTLGRSAHHQRQIRMCENSFRLVPSSRPAHRSRQMSEFPASVRRVVRKDGCVQSSRGPSHIVEAIDAFFAEHNVASLRLPSGWFGRPHDNMHQLSKVAMEGDHVLVILDGKQVLTLDAVGASQVGRFLSITVRSGRWDWVEYGGYDEHTEALGSGDVEFHAF